MISLTKLLQGATLAVFVAMPSFVQAASPHLDFVLPRGAQRGGDVEMTLRGDRLEDAQEVLFYRPGITVTELKPEGKNAVKCKFKIAADAAYGEYDLRIRTATGISDLRNFYVGVYPVVEEMAQVGQTPRKRDPKAPAVAAVPPDELPSTFAKPQKIQQNITVAGVLENEQADFYAVECKKGERLNVEVEAMRLGNILDTNLTIFDEKRFEIAGNDDNAFSKQDAFVTTLIPHDGTFTIQIRESSYGGGPNGYYRMHVGQFPRPKAIFPAGGKAGDELKVRCIGDAAGEFEQTIKIPATPGQEFPFYAEQNKLLAPTPNVFRVSSFGNVIEAEPNDTFATATAYAGELPIALNGIIDHPGDVDFFKFKAKKGQALELNVYARRLRTPLDSILTIYDAAGHEIASNDDTNGPDSYIRFNVAADGEYGLSVRDHLSKGGPEFAYRVEITEVKASLVLAIPNADVNATQDRQWVVVPKGGRYGTTIRATRAEFAGDLKLIADHLPPGVTMTAEPLTRGMDTFAVVFQAAADAPIGGALCDLTAKPLDDKVPVTGEFRQVVELAQNGNNAPYYITTVGQIAVAVAEPAPYTIEVVQPKVPLVQNGSMDLKVKITRRSDWKGAITVRNLWAPGEIGSATLTIAPEQVEGILTINAQSNAPIGHFKMSLLASAEANGTTWLASNVIDVEVAAPFLTASIQRSRVTQGESVQITVKLVQASPFDGKAKVQLLGLPNEATTADKEISKTDSELVFDVQTTAKTPAATHNGLLCRVTIIKDGEPIQHNLGAGGIVRVDAIRKPEETDPTKGKPKPVAQAK